MSKTTIGKQEKWGSDGPMRPHEACSTFLWRFFFMDFVPTAPRHNIDDSQRCGGVKESLMSMQKGAKNGQNAQFRIH